MRLGKLEVLVMELTRYDISTIKKISNRGLMQHLNALTIV
jgi:hypothetical protein